MKKSKKRKSTAKNDTKIDEAAKAAAELKAVQETVMPKKETIIPEIIIPEKKTEKAEKKTDTVIIDVEAKTENTKTEKDSKNMNTDNTNTSTDNTDSKETNVSDNNTPTRRQRLRNWSQTVKAMDFKVTRASVLNRKIEKNLAKQIAKQEELVKAEEIKDAEKRAKKIE